MPALIYRKNSSIHSSGAFAKCDIKKGTRVVQYTGRRLTLAQAERGNETYHYELNSRTIIDGKNVARYANHSCKPNCESDVIRGKIWIIAMRDIKKGEEVTYNYQYRVSEGLRYPCRCGTDRCLGYIVGDDMRWYLKQYLKKQKLKKAQKKKAKKKPKHHTNIHAKKIIK